MNFSRHSSRERVRTIGLPMPADLQVKKEAVMSHVEASDVTREGECQGDRQLRTGGLAPASEHLLRWVNKLLFSSRSICLHNMQI